MCAYLPANFHITPLRLRERSLRFRPKKQANAHLTTHTPCFPGCSGNPDAKRLYDDLLSNYNKLVRPVINVTDALTVKIKLKLSQLIDVVSTYRFFLNQTKLEYIFSMYLPNKESRNVGVTYVYMYYNYFSEFAYS